MTQILEEWVRNRLGIAVDFNKVGNEFYDGNLFFKILQSYDVVGPELKLYMRRAKTPEEALRNLNLLRLNFRLLGVLKDISLLEEISRKDDRACTVLLTELYLKLSNRHSLPFVSEAKEKQVQQQGSSRFEILKVTEKKCLLPTKKGPEEKLLSKLKESVNASEDLPSIQSIQIRNKTIETLREASQKITDQIKKNIEECKCGTTLQECLDKFDQKVMEYQVIGENINTPCPPDDYVKMLKLRQVKQMVDKKTESKFKDIIIKRLWCKQMKEREEELKSSLSKKLLKQSTYEKEMAQRLGRIHLQYRIMAERRRRIHEESQRIYQNRLNTIEWHQNTNGDKKYFKEKERLQELHRNIYNERMAKLQEEKRMLIYSVVSDLVDISIKIARYQKEHSTIIPNKDLQQLKVLFFKSLPIFQKASFILINEDDRSNSNESFDIYIHKEPMYEEELNKQDLNDYLILLGPWAKEMWPDLENLEEEVNVLGFVVHRLLENKYPLPKPPKPADIPMYPIRVIVNNLTDNKAIITLKSLLEKPKIDVIDLTNLINICIGQFKAEAGIEDKLKEKEERKKGKKKGNDKDVKKKKKGKVEEPPFKTVETQFPSEINLDSPKKLSPFAEIGKRAFEILGAGDSLSEELVADILIEYLQVPKELEGWILVNFPVDCKQVYYMETKLTGIEPPIKCDMFLDKDVKTEQTLSSVKSESGLFPLMDEDGSLHSDSDLSLTKLIKLRTSVLVPRPNPEPPKQEFHTYFTHFIQVESAVEKIVNDPLNATKAGLEDKPLSTESSDIIQTPKSFYEGTDIYVEYEYTKLDLPTLKRLARIIINESDEQGPERKPSIELFGEVAVQKLPKRKSLKSSSQSKMKPLKEINIEVKSKDSIVEELEVTADAAPIPDEIPKLCEVAELCWEYTTLDIPNELMITLASFWESVEITYINNFKDIFAIYRDHDTVTVPYRNSLIKKITSLMEIPDTRQFILDEFVEELNSLDDILRSNSDVKKELFCKIFELQLKLWDFCDSKKNLCEQEIQNVINEKWLPRHASSLYNIYLSMLETEVDRTFDTLKLLQDYYLSSLGKPTNSESIQKLYIPRYKLSDFQDYIDDTSLESEESESINVHQKSSLVLNTSFVKRTIEIALDPAGISEYYRQGLSNEDFTHNGDPKSKFHENINQSVEKLQEEVSVLVNNCLALIDKENKLFQPKNKKQTKKGKNQSTKGKKKKQDPIPEAIYTDEAQTKLKNALMEWLKGVQDEKDRIFFRMNLIKNRFTQDLTELEELIFSAFQGLHREISTRYFDQSKNVDSVLRVLMASVEAESKIEPHLELTVNSFCVVPVRSSISINSEVLPPPPVTPINEIDEDFKFTIQQLMNFSNKMVSVSPLGITIESLIAIIEDMVLFGKENGHSYLPKGWAKLTRNNIRTIIRSIFGDVLVADWKDLLMFGLNFRFPTVNEIIQLRDTFLALDIARTETISQEDFKNVTLWFEKDLCNTLVEDLRVALGKRFIFNLYQVSTESMNYTAFLLNCCKDEHPVDGFGKALALSTGFGYVLHHEKLHLLIGEEKTESEIIVGQIINILLQDSINGALGTVITEVDDEGKRKIDNDFEYVKNDHGFMIAEMLLESIQSRKEDSVPQVKSESLLSRRSRRSRSSVKSKEKQSLASSKSASQTSNTEKEVLLSYDCKSLESNIVWKSWIPREVVLSLLLTCLNTYALPEDKYYLQEQVETEIKSIYEEFGKNDCIQGHILTETQFIKKLLSTCHKFKSCDLSYLIKSTLDSNSSTF